MNLACKKLARPLALIAIPLALALAGTFPSQVEGASDEDLSDNEICLDCHIDEEQVGALEVAGVQVHNPENSTLIVEAHTEAACIDCHMDIKEVPHRDEIERTVNCLECHEAIPE
jgi:hypothetical protein